MELVENMKQRLVSYVRNTEKISNRDFERKVGLSDGFLSRPGTISTDSLMKIAVSCPELSLRWLILGDGEMLRNKNSNVSIVNNAENSRINNVNGSVFGGIDNSTFHIESVCNEVRALQAALHDLRMERDEEHRINGDLHKENQRLLDLLSRFMP